MRTRSIRRSFRSEKSILFDFVKKLSSVCLPSSSQTANSTSEVFVFRLDFPSTRIAGACRNFRHLLLLRRSLKARTSARETSIYRNLCSIVSDLLLSHRHDALHASLGHLVVHEGRRPAGVSLGECVNLRCLAHTRTRLFRRRLAVERL